MDEKLNLHTTAVKNDVATIKNDVTMGVPYMRVPHGRVPHGRAPHECVPQRTVSRERAPHWVCTS
jgi:hypothetical protein